MNLTAKQWEEKYHVDMNNYRSQVQVWQSEYDNRIVNLSKNNERLRNAILKAENFLVGVANTEYATLAEKEVFKILREVLENPTDF